MAPQTHVVLDRASLDRRTFIGGLAAGAALGARGLAVAKEADGLNAEQSFPGMISRQKNPDNLEFPFATLNSFITPNEQFYVRTHFEEPRIEPTEWRVAIEGHVEKRVEIGIEELRKMPARTVTAVMECSGNGRVFLKPPQLGIRWEQGGVGNAEWTGVPLAALLERAGVKSGGVEVILEGADKGKLEPPQTKTPGVIHYARSLPLAKARSEDVLVALRMNGKELPPAHGFPARVVVPGWYGMASVKWLKRIVVTDRPFEGFFQTFAYTIWQRREGLPTLAPVTELVVKSQIARPTLHEVLKPGEPYRVVGAAWCGEGQIAKVEFSSDGGKSWSSTRLLGDAAPHAWRLWDYEWTVPKQAGKLTLMARATDSKGNVQPMERDEDLRDAMISHVQRIGVEVR